MLVEKDVSERILSLYDAEDLELCEAYAVQSPPAKMVLLEDGRDKSVYWETWHVQFSFKPVPGMAGGHFE